jgi:hypothetical protein
MGCGHSTITDSICTDFMHLQPVTTRLDLSCMLPVYLMRCFFFLCSFTSLVVQHVFDLDALLLVGSCAWTAATTAADTSCSSALQRSTPTWQTQCGMPAQQQQQRQAASVTGLRMSGRCGLALLLMRARWQQERMLSR